jgi:hypothetical protein
MSTRTIELHVGDVGTEIIISLVDESTPVDLSAMTSAVIKVQRPDRTVAEITADVDGDPEDGIIKGVVSSGTFIARGNHVFQAFLTIGAWTGHSQSVTVYVNPIVPNV